jgi:hypothetical protein
MAVVFDGFLKGVKGWTGMETPTMVERPSILYL